MKATHRSLYAFLGAWIAGELRAAVDQGQGSYSAVNGLKELTESLPSFGDPLGPWQAVTERHEQRPGEGFVASNVSEFYWVDGPRVQFFCAQGRVTVYPLEGQSRRDAEAAYAAICPEARWERLGRRGA